MNDAEVVFYLHIWKAMTPMPSLCAYTFGAATLMASLCACTSGRP